MFRRSQEVELDVADRSQMVDQMALVGSTTMGSYSVV
jgi:hypothetical protein